MEAEYVSDGGTVKRTFKLTDEKERRELSKVVDSREILTMHTKEATLEEIFIQVTGKGLD